MSGVRCAFHSIGAFKGCQSCKAAQAAHDREVWNAALDAVGELLPEILMAMHQGENPASAARRLRAKVAK